MNRDKLSQIVESVYKATINGSLKWELSSSCFNSDTRHKHESISTDGITKFYCEVRLSNDMKLDPLQYCPMHVSNPNMIDDGVYLYPREYPLVIDLQKWLYENLVLPKINIANQDKVMDDILKGTDISEFRDKKLDSILSDQLIKASNDLPIEEEPKKSLIRKIFGK